GRVARLATQYEDQSEKQDEGTSFEIPEDLSGLDDEALAALHTEAVQHFDALYGDGSNLSDQDIEALAALTDGIEMLNAEQAQREEQAAARAEKAAELAARVRGKGEEDADSAEAPEDGEGEDAEATAAAEEESEADGEGDGDRKSTRLNSSHVKISYAV